MDAESPLFACSYSTNIILDKLDNTGEFLAVSNETGHLSILDSESKKVISIGEFPDSLFDLDWNKNNDNIALAGGDNSVYVTSAINPSEPFACLTFHQSSVRSVKFNPNNPNLIASGSRDGDICIWDLRNPSSFQPIKSITKAHGRQKISKKTNSSDNSIVLHLEYPKIFDQYIVSIGQPDYSIKIWDLRYSWGKGVIPKPCQVITNPNGRSFSSLSSHGTMLYASNLDNSVYSYCMSNYSSEPFQTFRSPQLYINSFYIRSRVNHDGQIIACGSTNGNIILWSTNSTNKFQDNGYCIETHDREITSVSWHPHSNTLISVGECGVINEWKSKINETNTFDEIARNNFKNFIMKKIKKKILSNSNINGNDGNGMANENGRLSLSSSLSLLKLSLPSQSQLQSSLSLPSLLEKEKNDSISLVIDNEKENNSNQNDHFNNNNNDNTTIPTIPYLINLPNRNSKINQIEKPPKRQKRSLSLLDFFTPIKQAKNYKKI